MAKKGLHGWATLPRGEVAALFHAINLDVACGSLDLLLRASTGSEAVRAAKAPGLHGVHLKSDPCPPSQGDLAVLLAFGRVLLWRRFASDSEWQPGTTLPRIK